MSKFPGTQSKGTGTKNRCPCGRERDDERKELDAGRDWEENGMRIAAKGGIGMVLPRRKKGSRIAFALLSALMFASCGGGSSTTDGGGTGGTGVGPVTGFGSVIVNGIAYDDAGIDNTNFLDDHGRTKADLAAGMMVKVTAAGVNDLQGIGTATKIEVQRHVDGPLDNNGVDLATGTFRVMGQAVLADTTTVFDNVADLVAVDNLAGSGNRPELEVHGIADNAGTIHATFVHLWDNNIVAGRAVQVKGTVENDNAVGKTFTLGTSRVSYATIVPAPAGLDNGVFVEVKGTFQAADNTIAATSVTVGDPASGQSAGDLVKSEGYVKRIIAAGAQFELIGADGLQRINWSGGTTAFKDGTAADLLAGARVVVEGKRNLDKTVAAKEISFRKPSNIRMDTTVTVPASPPASLRLFGKTVFVNSLTQFRDSAGTTPLRTFGLANIATDNTLRVSAFLDNSTGAMRIVASRIERIDPLAIDRKILQGIVELKLGGANVRILGITVQTFPGSTEFLNADGTPFPGATENERQANFFAAVVEGRTVVRARGTAGSPTVVMIANEVRIQPTIDN
ncbi:MAG: hypothetical protein A2Z26_02505 [Deltaproteobacteria bacterium RBG_16_66_15]|nr:MAG: hypothetical protein A2X90_08335 [Deltaproteobacteria bacterium GWA2_65_63]OGP77788.1 MAG: hypothetical protein A2Z26_02505 [Deltaproteobacteria bacterium RBG_16_66_15]